MKPASLPWRRSHASTACRRPAQHPARVGGDHAGALAKLAAATQSHRGCIEFKLYESVSAPGTFVTVETWESREDHESHMQTEDLAAALAAAEGHVDGDIAIHLLRPV